MNPTKTPTIELSGYLYFNGNVLQVSNRMGRANNAPTYTVTEVNLSVSSRHQPFAKIYVVPKERQKGFNGKLYKVRLRPDENSWGDKNKKQGQIYSVCILM